MTAQTFALPACVRATARLCASALAEIEARIGRGIENLLCYKTAACEFRLLHHHGGAVFLVAGRQRAARCRDRIADAGRCANLAHAVPEVLLRRFLRGAGAL